MSQDYSPSLVTKNLVFCGDAAMKSAAGPATLLYDKVNDNNGTMYNANCVDFDGTDAYVTYGDVTWLDGLTTISVCCWLYQDGAPPNSGGVFLSKDNAIECWTKQSTTNQFVLSINNNHQIFSGASTPATGEWVHVVMTWNSTGDVRKLYLNGALVDTNTSGSQSGNSINNTADGLAIGARANGNYEIDGKIADTKIFSKELSAANVKELYDDSKVIIPAKNDASGGFLSQTDLTLWAPLTDGAGTIAYDGSGYGRDGTYTGTSFLSGQTGAPQLVEGYNRPLLGDGATDLRVNFGDPSSDVDIGTGDFALGYWVNPKTITGNYVGHVTYTASAAAARFEAAFYGGTTRVFTTNSSWNDTLYAPPLNTWTHFLWIRESGGLYLHINGSSSASWSLSSVVTLGPCTSLTMFNHGAAGGYPSFDGLLNEVVFYVGTSLSNAQKAALAATGPNGGPLPPNPASGPSSLPSTSYLKGYWRNDSDVTWTDLSGSGNDGTVTNSNGSILLKQGINGSKNVNTGRDNQGFPLRCQNNGAIGFKDGSTDHVTIPTSMDFQVSTLLLWVKFTELGRYFISSTGASPGYYQWYVYATGKLQFEYSRTETGVAANAIHGTAGDVSTDTWYQLGVILDSGGATGTMYKDGNLLVQSVWSSTGALTPTSIYAGPTSSSFGGQMANLQMYNRALTYAEIQQNYNSFKARFGK